MIKELLSLDNIQLGVDVDNWKEAIEVAAQPLLEKDVITRDYVNAMVESVIKFGAYIVIGPGLALAHARPEDGANELGLSITTLKTPVNFGSVDNDPVKIIFCLAAVDSHSHLDVMQAIVRLLYKPGRIEELSKSETKEELVSKLFNEEWLKWLNA